MNKIFLCLMFFVVTAFLAQPSEAQTYRCVRPDGTVVCTITTNQTDPSVVCNHDCPDCNLVCVAEARVTRESEEYYSAPAKPAPRARGNKTFSSSKGGDPVETKAYCRQQYNSCVSECRSSPGNRSSYDVEACISSCKSTFTGCGKKPSNY